MDDELLGLDAVGEAEAIRAGRLSALELTDFYLDRIDRLDGALRSYVSLDPDGARRAAKEIDEKRGASGPLAGATFSIKDVDDVAGLPTTHSCALLADNIAKEDDAVVRRFRKAGLVILGKTNVPEFCSSMTGSRLNGLCRNPWDMERTPSGSSGGAGAAAAARLCSAAHGTDGAGSVRVPAAYCGLVGVKPTRGLVNFGPEEGLAYYQTSVPGVLTRTVRDAAALLDALAPAADPWTPARPHAFFDEIAKPPNSLRIAFSTDAPAGKTDPQCILAIHTVVHALETLGHLVDEATPDWAELAPAAAIPMSAPGPADLIDLADAQKVEPRNVQMIQRAAAMTMLEHSRLVDATRAATRRFMPFWDKYDILVSPASGMLTPPVDETLWELDAQTRNARIGGFPLWARPFNITGQPAISVPVAWTSTGLPIGVQLAGRHLDEALLLRVAAQLEQEFPWAERLKKLAASL